MSTHLLVKTDQLRFFFLVKQKKECMQRCEQCCASFRKRALFLIHVVLPYYVYDMCYYITVISTQEAIFSLKLA